MKILYLIDTLEIGGAEKSLLEIIRHFSRVQPLMCHLYPGQTLKPAYEQVGIPVVSLDVPGKYSFSSVIKLVKAVVQQEQVDLIHTALFRADIVGRFVGWALDTPVVSSFLNEPYAPIRWRSLSRLQQIKLGGAQILDALSARWVYHFIANSETVKSANAKALRVPLEKVEVIYRGRDPEPLIYYSPSQLETTRTALELKAENLILLNVARLLNRKGQADLIQAMPFVLQVFPQARLLIAGEGIHRAEVEKLIRDLGVGKFVHLLGYRDDIPALLQLANMFVFPSYYEGYPGALVEAMMAACPIVASDIPVHHEAITPNQTGKLVPIKNAEVLAGEIKWMLQHSAEAKQMGERARREAMERFHIDRVAAQHEALYEKVLQQWQAQRN